MAIAIISEAFVHVLESDIALGDVDDMWDYMHELDLVKKVKKLAGLEEKVDNILHSFHELHVHVQILVIQLVYDLRLHDGAQIL